MTTFYKIQHKKTGLFSRGGTYVDAAGNIGWSKEGKVWSTLGRLRAHLSMHLGSKYRAGTDMTDWQVVELETRVVSVVPAFEAISATKLVQMLKS